jgi:hypothetical protein
MAIAVVFHTARVRADLKAAGLSTTDLVKRWLGSEARKRQYVFESAEYQRVWHRVNRFLKGRGSLETADTIATLLGVPRDRYASIVIKSK